MPRVQPDYAPGAEALRTTAAPNIQTVQTRFDPNANSAIQLAEALGKAQPVLDKFNQDYERNKLQEQLLKLDTYKEGFKGSQAGVTSTQVGEKYPETNPIVRARIAEGAGSDYGKTLIQPIIDSVLQDDSIRLDTAAREAYIKEKRQTLISNLGGDDFYKAGAIRAIDAELKTFENSWQQQTAVYHQQIQSKDFSGKVVEALGAENPGKALEDLDAAWKQSSSLNNIERNKLVIDTVTKQAFAADDPSLLDKIPTRFLNADSRAELAQTKAQIQSQRMTNYRNAQYLQQQQREENIRNGKIEMLNDVVANKDIDPAKYRKEPELFGYAMNMKDAGRIPEAKSVGNAQTIRTAILDGSTTAGLDQNTIIKGILDNPSVNPREKQKLIEEVPKLLEGRLAMDDPMVKNALQIRLDPALKALESSTNARIQNLITGENLRGQAMAMFDKGIQAQFYAYYEDHKAFPTGKVKLEIIDSEIAKAEKYIAERTKIGGSSSSQAPAAPTTGGKVRKFNQATGKIE